MSYDTTDCRLLAGLRPVPCTSSPIPGDESDLGSHRETNWVPLAMIKVEGQILGKFRQVIKIPVRRDRPIRIGSDKEKSNLRIKNSAISPLHCEIYSVVFENGDDFLPLIYIRDCQSTTGTYVNDHSIGSGPMSTAATLLENGDSIRIGPCTLCIYDYTAQRENMAMSQAQRKEASLFNDQYVVKDTIIGYGSFATVRLAVDVKTKRQVICKVHDLEGLRELETSAVDHVDREMAIWSHLDHPNILAFHRAFRTNRSMFAFAELATGGDLFSLLESRKVLPELEIKWILKQVLEAVAYLHSKGIAHQDIKPENILCTISPQATYGIALADFGCSGVKSLGRMPNDVGTFPYRAPEILLAGGEHGVSVDIWAIGVLMLQLISGADVINMPTEFAIMSEVEHFVWSVVCRRTISREKPISIVGINFIMSCLNLDPKKRPSAMKALRHDWLDRNRHEKCLFEEREKQLAWKPRDLLIPTIVDLREKTAAAFGADICDKDDGSGRVDEAQIPIHDNSKLDHVILPASEETYSLHQHIQIWERGQTIAVTGWGHPAAINNRKRSAP